MSLILEALRKSEAERRRGRMPDLHAELPPAPTRAAASTPWRWRIVLAAAALLALAAWLATSAWRPQETAVALRPMPAVATPTPALPPVSHLQPTPRPQRLSARAGPAPAPTVDADRAVPHGPAQLTAAPDARDPAARADAAVVRVETSRQATTQPSASPPPPPPPARTVDLAPMQLSDLAPDARKALPPLRLSMHLWNDDPSRRFVILDGERLGEGDRIGNLVVTGIVRDGVLLDWNGRAIKVPLR